MQEREKNANNFHSGRWGSEMKQNNVGNEKKKKTNINERGKAIFVTESIKDILYT
jgi:hypothetical protein